MANVRDLKKDMKHMVRHFLNECYSQLAYNPPLHQENILDIIADTIQLQEDIVSRVNAANYSKNEQRAGKAYYQDLAIEFYDRVVELTERLNSLEF
ncbi:MAG: hypothetical protein JW783_15485 [Bacteroidales bacterium]|nr:hypothetical protein [Bacteroidales bacterium]MBN2750381.1 hypothetical protein [Bacteroidales bacterium]